VNVSAKISVGKLHMYQKKITFVCRQYVNKQQLRKGKQTLADVTRHQARKAERKAM